MSYVIFLPLLLDVLPRFGRRFGSTVVPFHVQVHVSLGPRLVKHQRQLGQKQVIFQQHYNV